MINIAVMGYGTVGSGVVKVINTNDNKISLSMKALEDHSAEQTEE